MGSITILEGNCFLHSGEASWSKNFNIMGFPTGGIYQLMSKIIKLYADRRDFVVVFDSPSFRRSVNDEYKKSRKVNNKILAQSNALIPMLKRANVDVLQVNGFEGDDLVANIVAKNPDSRVVIYTCDYDLAMNVSDKVEIIGCKSGFPTITKYNFQSVVKDGNRGDRIPYNALGIHKVIYGCDSDEIRGIGGEADKMWKVFNAILKRDFTDKGMCLLVNREWTEKFGGLIGGLFNNDTMKKYNENIGLVFPRMLTDKEIADNNVKLTGYNYLDIDEGAILDTCHIFGLNKCIKSLTHGEENWELEEKEKQWILKRANNYKMSADAIDAEIGFEDNVKYNGSDEVKPVKKVSADFSQVSGGMNIGEF